MATGKMTLRHEIADAIQRLLATAATTYGSAAIEPQMASICNLLQQVEGDDRESVVQDLIALMDEHGPYLRLCRPGVVELFEYTMHALRWSEIEVAVLAISDTASDPRVRQAARRVLSAYMNEWSNADIYDAYRKD